MASADAAETVSDAEVRVVDENGVDLTLVRAYLALTPLERLRSLQNAVRALQKFKRPTSEAE